MTRQQHAVRPWPASTRGNTALQESPKGNSDPSVDHVIVAYKRGRRLVIAKLVHATPLNELVLAMPYRHRQTVEHVSVPPSVLAHARQYGVRSWVVRFDTLGQCSALPLAEVERAGWLKPSDGRPEWFVPLSRFQPVPWQQWDFTEAEVTLEDAPLSLPAAALRLPEVRQISMFDMVVSP